MEWVLHPTLGGAALAGLAVAGGAPLFSDGLRTLRLRRAFARLGSAPADEVAGGLVRLAGRVALESPLFGPLSGRPCAGFRLEVRAATGTSAAVEERRAFRLIAGGLIAHVRGLGRWDLAPGQERVVDAEHPPSANVEALLQRSPEARWLRGSGARLVLTERLLAAGASCHVTGFARRSRLWEADLEAEGLRTGTDDGTSFVPRPSEAMADPDLWIDDGGHLDYLHVSDRAPDGAPPLPSLARVAGVALGPLLSLAGLLYLANAADGLRSAGRF